MAQRAHWAALIDMATWVTGFISSQVDFRDEDTLYGPVIRTFAPQSDVRQPIQPADLLNTTWKKKKKKRFIFNSVLLVILLR